MTRRSSPVLAVIAVSAIMGLLGYVLLFGFGPTVLGFHGWLAFLVLGGMVIAASVLLWLGLSALIGPRSLATWAAVGLASPLLGGLLLAPPASYLVLFRTPFVSVISITVGMATGLLIGRVLRDPGKAALEV